MQICAVRHICTQHYWTLTGSGTCIINFVVSAIYILLHSAHFMSETARRPALTAMPRTMRVLLEERTVPTFEGRGWARGSVVIPRESPPYWAQFICLTETLSLSFYEPISIFVLWRDGASLHLGEWVELTIYCPSVFCDVSAQGGLRKPPSNFWTGWNIGTCDNPTSMVYKRFLNLAPFFKMAAKMADFLQKNVYSSIFVYIEAIFQSLMAKVIFGTKHKPW